MPGEFVAGVGYSNSFANFSHDMNGDGLPDAIIIGFPGDPFHWYQNPGVGEETHWKEHVIWTSACNESPEFEDLNGDGIPRDHYRFSAGSSDGLQHHSGSRQVQLRSSPFTQSAPPETPMRMARSSTTTAWVPAT
jgi:hypothetical protein